MRLLTLALIAFPALAFGQSDCIALASKDALVHRAAYAPAEGVTIRYLGHSMFGLTLPDGLLAVTDYYRPVGGDVVPGVVTMNNAHDTHFTLNPDPRIPVVVEGWGLPGMPAAVDMELGELRLRNVTTDLRGPFGEGGAQDGNSIFIFEAEGLCIVHLGHLHQQLSAAKRAMIGRVDVLMVPVDGGFTMAQEAVVEEVRGLNPRIVLPMHWFSAPRREAFLAQLTGFERVDVEGPEITVTRDSLPEVPQVVVLTPALFP